VVAALVVACELVCVVRGQIFFTFFSFSLKQNGDLMPYIGGEFL